MVKSTRSITLMSLVAVLSVTPTIAFASPAAGCRPDDTADLRTYFHRAEFHMSDGLGVYLRDLSAYGRPTTGRSVSAATTATAHAAETRTGATRSATPRVDLAKARAFFYSGAFAAGDGLVAYAGR